MAICLQKNLATSADPWGTIPSVATNKCLPKPVPLPPAGGPAFPGKSGVVPTRPVPTPGTFTRYLSAGSREKSWGLQITGAGYLKTEPQGGCVSPANLKTIDRSWPAGRRLQEYQLHYFPRGGGRFESGPSGVCQIEAGDFCLVFPGMLHRCVPNPQSGWDEYWVGFKGPQIDQLVRQGYFTATKPVLRPAVGHEALEQFLDIFAELQAEAPGIMPVVAARTMLLLARILASRPDRSRADQTDADRIIRSAKCILRSNLDQDVDLQDLAATLKTSYTWLRRSFRLCTGMSLHQYHLQLRLQKAWQLLSTSGCTVREAAEQTGFNDEFYFSRLFKLKTGRSPETLKPPSLAQRGPPKLNPVSKIIAG